MPAPRNNQFYLLRSKHGRDRLFKSSKLLWSAACEYFQWSIDNPLMELQQAKSSGIPFKDPETKEIVWPSNTIEMPKMRAFTMQGLCQYLNCNVRYFDQFENSLAGKTDEQNKDFSTIITRIRETVFNQKYTGAAAGFLNANIIARDLGLTDKKDVRVDYEKLLSNLNEENLTRLATEMLRQQLQQ